MKLNKSAGDINMQCCCLYQSSGCFKLPYVSHHGVGHEIFKNQHLFKIFHTKTHNLLPQVSVAIILVMKSRFVKSL